MPDKLFLRNKIAQLFALSFVIDFPRRWPTYFSDILSLLSMSTLCTDLYLKIMLAIDAEVVDRDIAHTDKVSANKILFWVLVTPTVLSREII